MSKYKLKEIWDLTDQDREDIYQYAIQRSNEIVSGQTLQASVPIAPCKKCGTVPSLGLIDGNVSIGHSCVWEKGQPLDWWQGSVEEWNKRNEERRI
jgi:hypothetical protein